MAEARKSAASAQDAQAAKEAEDAKVRDSAKQDTSAVTSAEDPLNPADLEGVRPAAGTPKQVVEAGPGVEIDADLDQAEVNRADSGDVDDASKSDLLTLARVKAPSLTAEFVKQYGLTDEDLKAIARGEVSPPPTVGPIHNVDLHRTPGGWQITPVGVPPEDAGKNAISR